MTVKYGKFEIPREISIDKTTMTSTYARFIVEPFERGYGHTIGNFLRRILLTSLEAPAIISVRIEGIQHEYMATEGIVEDMTHIILNFKGALLRKITHAEDTTSRDTRMVTTEVEVTQEDLDANQGEVAVCLQDMIFEGGFEVVNPEHVLFTVTKPMKKQVDLRIAVGRGYVPSERHIISQPLQDEIVIDTAFSPVRIVSYYVENTRVGQDTDFDRLILEVTTDGRISPKEALSFASQIGTRHLQVFDQLKELDLNFDEEGVLSDSEHDEMMNKLSLRIDEIELSVRSTNCLAGADIESIGELVALPEGAMLKFRNFGKKSLNEIKAKLSEMGLYLGMDLARYGLTQENRREKLREYREKRRGKWEQAKDEDEYPDEEDEENSNLEEIHETP